MTIPFCARCGHPLTTHALNRRAFSECSACGPCAFVPIRLRSRRARAAWGAAWLLAQFVAVALISIGIVTALYIVGRFL